MQPMPAHLISAGVGAALALLVTRLLQHGRSATKEEPVAQQEPERPRSLSLPDQAMVLKRSKSLNSGEPSPRSQLGLKKKAPDPARQESKSAAGDSDSDEEGNTGPKIPRELLSPVPRDQLTSIVVFGADGNLAKKKLLPTLYILWRRRLLPRDCLVFGFARPKGGGGALSSTAEFRAWLLEILDPPKAKRRDSHEEDNNENATANYTVGEFVMRCHFAAGQFGDATSTAQLLALVSSEEQKRLGARGVGGRQRISSKEEGGVTTSDVVSLGGGESSPSAARMYYLSVPPFLYAQICSALATARASSKYVAPANLREQFVLEKPFGRDDKTCSELMGRLSMIRPQETFYIDHCKPLARRHRLKRETQLCNPSRCAHQKKAAL